MGLSSKQASQGDSLEYWSQLQVGDHLDVDNVPKPKPKEATNEFTRNNINQQKQQQQSKAPPLSCPRCDSTNTKFCYYNNYSKLQPRHFCRACKRHWTAGGTLRNVPVGGGSRKNGKGKRSTPRTAATVRHANTADVNNEEEQRLQQQLLSAGTMFTDIFEQVMFHQPADDQMMTMHPDDQLKLNPGIEIGVGSSSSSSLSKASPNSILFGESMLNLTDVGYDHGGACWNDAASYWNCTWDGVNDGSV